MSKSVSYACSTIGRKQLVAISGFIWVLFVLSHMAGNLLIFAGAEFYNKYSHAITSNPLLLYGAESVLLLALIVHVALTVMLTIENRRARPQGYAKMARGKKATSAASKTLIFQGTIILAFIILHLITFKYGPVYDVTYDGVQMRDIHRLVIEVFASPVYVGWYVVSLLLLCTHLSHGVASVFQTWGFNHPKYNNMISCLSYGYGFVVTLGFISQPVYVFLQR